MTQRLFLSKLLPLGLIGILASWVMLLQVTRLRQLNEPSTVELTQSQLERQQRQTQAQLIALSQAPSFGFDNMAANWTFLQFLQYFGDMPARQQTGYGLSPYFFEAIIPRDPVHARPYIFLSASTSAHAAQPNRAVALMEAGLAHMQPNLPPDAYLVWRFKGLDEFLFLRDYAAAQVSLATAAQWVQQSDTPDRETIADSLQQTANFLAQNPTGQEAQIGAWAQVLAQAADDATRAIAIENIEALGGEIIISERGVASIRFRDNAEDAND